MHRIRARRRVRLPCTKSGAHYVRVGWCERLGHSWRRVAEPRSDSPQGTRTYSRPPEEHCLFHLERAIHKRGPNNFPCAETTRRLTISSVGVLFRPYE
jgi:hypothetical protein